MVLEKITFKPLTFLSLNPLLLCFLNNPSGFLTPKSHEITINGADSYLYIEEQVFFFFFYCLFFCFLCDFISSLSFTSLNPLDFSDSRAFHFSLIVCFHNNHTGLLRNQPVQNTFKMGRNHVCLSYIHRPLELNTSKSCKTSNNVMEVISKLHLFTSWPVFLRWTEIWWSALLMGSSLS